MGEYFPNARLNNDDVLFEARDGRSVAARITGPEYGIPVVAFHGSPGSRLGPHIGNEALLELGVRLIALDRPGYGLSDRKEGREIVDTAADVEDVMDQLDIERFAEVARSGGVPHALGCAAVLGSRVAGLVAFSGVAPKIAAIDWTKGMTDDNKRKHEAAVRNPSMLIADVFRHSDSMQTNAWHMIETLTPDLRPADTAAILAKLSTGSIRTNLKEAQVEAFRQDGVGWFDDILAFHKDWGVKIQTIESEVLLWHGAQDPFASPAHSQWLADNIPKATLVEDPEGSHMSSYIHGHQGLRIARDLYLGPSRTEALEAQLETMRLDIFKDMGVNEEEFKMTQNSGRLPEFTEEYTNWRAAKLLVEMGRAAVVRDFLESLRRS